MKKIGEIVGATAKAYFFSYKCLMDKHLEEWDLNSEYFSYYFVPAITTAAFSCELALKDICKHEIGEVPKEHNFKKLFNKLNKNTQKDIMNRTIKLYNMKSEMLNVTKRIDNNIFRELLKSHENLFIIWRYFYESLPSIDLDFIEAFLFCLNNMEEEYENYINYQRIKIT